MDWKKLKEEIYFCDGSLRDIYVKNTDSEDWKKWINLVNTNYKIDWYNGKIKQSEAKIDFEVIQEYWNGTRDLCSTASVFIEDLQVNSHFFNDSEIENDIDPREFKSINDHNKLIKYLKKVSNTCKKEVVVTLENCPEIILMKISGDRLEINIE